MGDVLLNEGSGSAKEVGKPAIWRGEIDDCCFQNTLVRVQPTGCSSEYLYFFFLWLARSGGVAAETQGVSIHHIGQAGVAKCRLPVPPLAEQRRIVARIEALFARTRRARTDLERIAALCKNYESAILDANTRVDLSNATFADVVRNTLYGPRFSDTAYVEEGGIPTIRTTDMDTRGRVILRDPPRVVVGPADFARWRIEEGDLLITRTGSIGRCAVAGQDTVGSLASAYLIRVRVHQDSIRPRYALLFLLSPAAQQYLKDGARAVTQPNINVPTLLSLPMTLPSLQQQDEAISAVDRAMDGAELLSHEATRALALLDHLEQSILARAFRGALVPQDPTEAAAAIADDADPPAPRRRARALA